MQRATSRNNRQYHGLGGTPTYNTWYSMIERCTNPDNASFVHYGAKGVRVCDRWLSSIEAFVEDMGLRPDGMTLDRIDRHGNYTPKNCRWATELEQQRNKGGVKCSPETAAQVRANAAAGIGQYEIARRIGISQSTVSRIVAGQIWR